MSPNFWTDMNRHAGYQIGIANTSIRWMAAVRTNSGTLLKPVMLVGVIRTEIVEFSQCVIPDTPLSYLQL
jgi:hypothetical protein